MSDRTEKQYDRFLAELALTGNISEACRIAGLNRRGVYHMREVNSEFAARWAEAIDTYVDRIEREAFRRAVEGIEDPLTHQGRFSYELRLNPDGSVMKDAAGDPMFELDENGRPKRLSVRKYSDALLQTLLKGNLPGKYRDNSTIKLGNEDGAFKVEESPTAAARKIAFALAVGLRAKAKGENASESDSGPLAGHPESGEDMV